METLIARAFVFLLLNPKQASDVRKTELDMPVGRYLQVSEIYASFGLPAQTIAGEREAKMKTLLELWRKENWKKGQIEEKDHEKRCQRITNGWCKCRTPQQEIHEWDQYVKANWFEPLPSASKRRAIDKFEKVQQGGNRGHDEKDQIEIDEDN